MCLFAYFGILQTKLNSDFPLIYERSLLFMSGLWFLVVFETRIQCSDIQLHVFTLQLIEIIRFKLILGQFCAFWQILDLNKNPLQRFMAIPILYLVGKNLEIAQKLFDLSMQRIRNFSKTTF